MGKKPIKIFLGGFVNATNSQNLNCRALAHYLNSEEYIIYTLEINSGDISSIKGVRKNVKVLTLFKPYRISYYFGFLWGIWHCDIAYLPKIEVWKWNRFLLKLFNKKSFKTDEGILDKKNLKDALGSNRTISTLQSIYSYTDRNFPISQFIGKYNNKILSLKRDIKPLYLGCDTKSFSTELTKKKELKSIAFIGRLKERKGVFEIVELATSFPKLDFYLFGDGPEKEKLIQESQEKGIENIHLMGIVSHEELAEFFKKIDLHILPSRSEGFPKVIMETAAAGIPSIVYADYGAEEWIDHGENGFVVQKLDEIKSTITHLLDNPENLNSLSRKAIAMAEDFDWKIQVKNWEREIISLSEK